MDDSFLYLLREQPRAEFTESLRRKLELSQPALPLWNRKLHLAFSLLLASLALAISLMSVTPVRSAVRSFLTRVGGLSFHIATDYPGDNSEEITIPGQKLPLDEAVALLPSPPRLPENVVLEPDAYVCNLGSGDAIFLRGRTQQGVRFSMTIMPNPNINGGEIVSPDSVEEIFLDADHPAALIRGGWNYDTRTWDSDPVDVVRIKWIMDDLIYDLGGNSDALAILLEIARSMLP